MKITFVYEDTEENIERFARYFGWDENHPEKKQIFVQKKAGELLLDSITRPINTFISQQYDQQKEAQAQAQQPVEKVTAEPEN